MSLTYWSFIC